LITISLASTFSAPVQRETEHEMVNTPDDLEAVRVVTTTLAAFKPDEQERIIRWAREKLKLPQVAQVSQNMPQAQSPPPTPAGRIETPSPANAKDLKTFVVGKSPKSDVQFAAAVAYYYRFEAPPEQRKDEIDGEVLQNATRLAGRTRLKRPGMTLNNAKNLGLLDSGSEAGKFAINTVGENLVAMTLPERSDSPAKGGKPRKQKRQADGSPIKKK